MQAWPRLVRPVILVPVAALAFGLLHASGPAEQEETGPFPKAGLFSVPQADQTSSAGTADDPAIWVHPTDPSLSLVIGTNKSSSGGLHVFDLDGQQVQFVPAPRLNNVDVRYGFLLGGVSVDLVSASNRANDGIDVYTVNPATRQLTKVGSIPAGIEVYGYAMYHSRATGKFYGIVASGDGAEQWEFVDQGNGSVGGVRVRTFPAGNLIEGIVADDELGYLYMAEEDFALYKYYAEANQPTTRLATVDVVGSPTQLVADIEGLTIYYRRNGTGYFLASSQGNNRYVVYRREGSNAYLGTFEIPGASDTDGIDVVNAALGPLYPLGMFVAQHSDTHFKMARWQDIADALGLAIDTQGYNVRGECPVESIEVSPADASVEVGATLQLDATLLGDSGTLDCTATWSSSNEAVATVGADGLVTGVSVGAVTITAAYGDVGGAAAITVEPSTNQPPVVNTITLPAGSEGTSLALLATFADADAGDTHTASITWGDDSPPQPGTVTGNNVTGSHVYANDGAYTVTVTVYDNRNGQGQLGATAVIANVTPTADAGGPYSGYAGVPVQLSGSATDPGADVLTFEWDFDYDMMTFNTDATGQMVQSTYAPGSYTVGLRVRDDDEVSAVSTSSVTVSLQPPVLLYYSPKTSVTLSGSQMANEDIVAFDGATFSLYFDGSDVGASSFTLDAFAVVSPTEILVSFTSAGTVGGVAMDDSDILKFTGTFGAATTGTFSMYFDGSDVGLSTSDEDVDAIEILPNGHLLLSTTSGVSVAGVSGSDEDLLEFAPTSLGATTAGTWAMYFDGSDVGLSTSSSEDVDGVAVDGAGRIYLSTVGSFAVSGLSGAAQDVFIFTPSSLGSATAGTFASSLFFDGSLYGLTGNMSDIDLP